MDRQGKQALRAEMADKFSKAKAAIIAEYRGMTVAELTTLRTNLRRSKAEFKVLKNRVTKKAVDEIAKAQNLQNDEINSHLKGPLGVAFLYGDAAQGTKAILDYSRENDKLKIIGGLVGPQYMSPAELKIVADLPPKEVLLSQIVGSLVSPHRGLVTVLSGVSRNLVQVINAVKDKKTN